MKLLIKIILLISFLSIGILCAQDNDFYLGTTRYSFIKYEDNRLLVPHGHEAFKKVFKTIDTIIEGGEGQLRITHLGGSHIQADIYTHQIRNRFQELSPNMNAGRGLIFPFKMAKTNNPSNYRVKYTGDWLYCKSTRSNRTCSLGLTGMAVYTQDSITSLAIELKNEFPQKKPFDKVLVFHENSPHSLTMKINERRYNGKYDLRLGATVFEMDSLFVELKLNIERDSFSEPFILYGLSLENELSGVVYDAIGVNGAKLSSYLSCDLYTQHMSAITPNLVVFSIGTNDGYTRKFDSYKYYTEFKNLLDSTKKAVPNAALLLTIPNDSYLYKKYSNKNTAEIRKIIYQLADEYQCGVWDFYDIMGGLNSAQDWYSLKLMNYDRVHFTRSGYKLKGELFFSAFLKAWESEHKRPDELIKISSLQPLQQNN